MTTHLHASKTAHVAVKAHRSGLGRFEVGDIVIVSEPELLPALYREGSLDPNVTVDASLLVGSGDASAATEASEPRQARAPKAKAKPAAKTTTRRKSPAAGRNRMVTEDAAEIRAEDEAGADPLPVEPTDADAHDSETSEGEES